MSISQTYATIEFIAQNNYAFPKPCRLWWLERWRVS